MYNSEGTQGVTSLLLGLPMWAHEKNKMTKKLDPGWWNIGLFGQFNDLAEFQITLPPTTMALNMAFAMLLLWDIYGIN